MNALISGRAGVAIVVDGDRLASLSLDPDAQPTSCSPRDIRFLLGDARDLFVVENANVEEIRKHLVVARDRDDALQLALFALDAELSDETRMESALALEGMLSLEGVRPFVEGVLLSHPVPPSADLEGAERLARRANADEVARLYGEISRLQSRVRAVWRAWESLPPSLFGDEEERSRVRAGFVREGVFGALVAHRLEEAARVARELSETHAWDGEAVLDAWIRSLNGVPGSGWRSTYKIEESPILVARDGSRHSTKGYLGNAPAGSDSLGQREGTFSMGERLSSFAANHAPLVLFFAANPASYVPLDLDGEIERIEAKLEESKRGNALRFRHERDTAADTLQRVLLAERPAVIQFSGHGVGAGGRGQEALRGGQPRRDLDVEDDRAYDDARAGIVVLGEDSAAASVSGEALGNLFGTVHRELGPEAEHERIRLVFLNACYSDEQATAILEHVDFVVGMKGAIRDDAAAAFSAAFYRGLAHGYTIQNAFALGVNALMLVGLDTEVDLPVLRSRPGANPSTARIVADVADGEDSLWHVFITYVKSDRSHALELGKALREQALRPFLAEEVGFGDFRLLQDDAIVNSLHGLVLVSTDTMNDPWVRTHYSTLLTKAAQEGRLLIPVLVGDGDVKLQGFIRNYRSADLRGTSTDDHKRVIDTIVRAIRRRR